MTTGVWKPGRRIFIWRRSFPSAGFAADRDLVPDYPGISESPSLADWDPPFPVDLKLVRKQDEDYWKQYRTTPKAFIQLSQRTGTLADAFWQLNVDPFSGWFRKSNRAA